MVGTLIYSTIVNIQYGLVEGIFAALLYLLFDYSMTSLKFSDKNDFTIHLVLSSTLIFHNLLDSSLLPYSILLAWGFIIYLPPNYKTLQLGRSLSK